MDRIIGIPATTLAGVLVKMRAMAWCRSDAPVTFKSLAPQEPRGRDMMLLAGIVNDLAAMPGGPSLAIG